MKFKKDGLYYLEFYDHCVGSKDIIKCKLTGWVTREDNISVTLSHWIVITEDTKVKNDNMELTNIIKSCITKKRLLQIK